MEAILGILEGILVLKRVRLNVSVNLDICKFWMCGLYQFKYVPIYSCIVERFCFLVIYKNEKEEVGQQPHKQITCDKPAATKPALDLSPSPV